MRIHLGVGLTFDRWFWLYEKTSYNKVDPPNYKKRNAKDKYVENWLSKLAIAQVKPGKSALK